MQFLNQGGAAFAASQHARISQIPYHSFNACVIPITAGAVFNPLVNEYVCDFMDAFSVLNIKVKDFTDNDRFLFIDCKVFLFVAFFIKPSALNELVTVGSVAALVMAAFHQ